MYHTLCLSFVRFESMDVIRGNFRLATEEQPSNKDGGGLEHSSGDFYASAEELATWYPNHKSTPKKRRSFWVSKPKSVPLKLVS